MANPVNLWRKFLALPNDNLTKTLVFAFLLALTASVVVSVAAVTLRPYQQANLEKERQARMAEIVSALPQISGLLDETGVDALEVRIVNLSTGEFEPDIDPASYDQRQAARDPERSTELPNFRTTTWLMTLGLERVCARSQQRDRRATVAGCLRNGRGH